MQDGVKAVGAALAITAASVTGVDQERDPLADQMAASDIQSGVNRGELLRELNTTHSASSTTSFSTDMPNFTTDLKKEATQEALGKAVRGLAENLGDLSSPERVALLRQSVSAGVNVISNENKVTVSITSTPEHPDNIMWIGTNVIRADTRGAGLQSYFDQLEKGAAPAANAAVIVYGDNNFTVVSHAYASTGIARDAEHGAIIEEFAARTAELRATLEFVNLVNGQTVEAHSKRHPAITDRSSEAAQEINRLLDPDNEAKEIINSLRAKFEFAPDTQPAGVQSRTYPQQGQKLTVQVWDPEIAAKIK